MLNMSRNVFMSATNTQFVSVAIHLSFEIFLFLLQFFDFGFHVGFSLLRLQRLSHAKGDAGFVERLVGRDGHANLVSNAKEKKPAFRAVDRYLPIDIISIVY